MNSKPKPTFEQLSLYYDGLLPPEERLRVEAYLDSGEKCDALELFASFNDALEPRLRDEDVERALSNTVQEVHARIQDLSPRGDSIWAFLFSPKFILTSIFGLLLFASAVSSVDWQAMGPGGETLAVLDEPEEQTTMVTLVEGLSNPDTREKMKEVAQGQALMALAGTLKNTVSTTLDYATQSSGQSGVSLSGSEKTLVANALRSAWDSSRTNDETSSQQESQNTLASIGQKQLAVGLSVSMLSLVTVF